MQPATRPRRSPAQRRGAALMLVLVALVIGSVLVMSFLSASGTSVAIASNANRHVTARHIAESGLQTALDMIAVSDDWRQNPQGLWFADQPYNEGTFSVWGWDGADLDGDGSVENGDGDFTDDPAEALTLMVRGNFGGVTHTVRAVVTPGASSTLRVLMVVGNANALTAVEQSRQTMLEDWGWVVSRLSANSDPAAYAAAVAGCDVVYVPGQTPAAPTAARLHQSPSGVVYDVAGMDATMGLVSGTRAVSQALQIQNNSHGVTAGLPLDTVELIHGAAVAAGTASNGAGTTLLAVQPGGSSAELVAAEAGSITGKADAGRRVASPLGMINGADLTGHGQRLLRQMLQWAAGQEPAEAPQLVALYDFQPVYEEPELVGHWSFDSVEVSGGGAALNDRLIVNSHAIIDGYDSRNGKYVPGHATSTTIATNATSSDAVLIQWHGTIKGDVLIGVGGDPDVVVEDPKGDGLQGDVAVLPVSIAPSAPSPTGSFTTATWSGGNGKKSTTTISTHTRYSNLTLNSHETLRVQGHIRIDVTGNLTLNSHSDIEIADGSSLALYVGGNVTINSHCHINNPSSDKGDHPERLLLSLYGGNSTLTLNAHADVAGTVLVNGDVIVNSHSNLYGAVHASDDITLNAHAALHMDSALAPAAGSHIGDETAIANDGLGLGVTTNPGGVTGTAVSFNGSSTVVIPHHDRYLLDSGAIALWFKAENVSQAQGLLSKDSMGFDTGGHLTLWIQSGELRARLQSTSGDRQIEGGSLQQGQWHHAVVSFGPSGFRLYVDGHLADSDSYTGGLGASSGGAGNFEPIVLGADSRESGDLSPTPLDDYFSGLIDEVQIYDAGLDMEQVARLHAGSEPGPSSTPSARLRDISGYLHPLDLYISRLDRVSWGTDSVTVEGPLSIASAGDAAKLRQAMLANDGFTIAMTITPASISQTGALVALGGDSPANVLLEQDAARLNALVRTTHAPTGQPTLASSDSMGTQLQHWAVTLVEQEVCFYRDGQLVGTASRTGALSNWLAGPLTLANDGAGASPWYGTLHRLSMYDRGLTAAEVAELADGHVPGSGGAPTSFRVTWVERP